MTLYEWLDGEDLTDSEFARQLGVTPATVHRLRTGTRAPSLALAQRIARATGGAVTPNDWADVEVA